jgi:hypothetical protein
MKIVRRLSKITVSISAAAILAASPQIGQASPGPDVKAPPASGVFVGGKLTAEPPVKPHLKRQKSDDLAGVLGSGGGCRNTLNIGSCINKLNNRLRGDFYYNFDNDLTDVALVAIVRNSDDKTLGWYTTNLDHLGHYPIQEWTISGSGAAYTVVDVYNNSLNDANYQFSAPSPLYFYP